MHCDHMDGAVHVGVPILVHDRELAYSRTRGARFFQRVLRQPVPSGADFKPLALDGGVFGAFARSRPLSDDGRIVAVDTPGHTPGHMSVVCVDDEERHVLLAGDTTDTLEQLHARRPDAVEPEAGGDGPDDGQDPRARPRASDRLPTFARHRIGRAAGCGDDALVGRAAVRASLPAARRAPLRVCGPAPPAIGIRAEIDQERQDDDEPLEAGDFVGAGTPHDRVGERRPGQQEEAEQRHEPAVERVARADR